MRGLPPPLDSQAAGLSFEGRAVPDNGAPFSFLAVWACPDPARRRRYDKQRIRLQSFSFESLGPAFISFP